MTMDAISNIHSRLHAENELPWKLCESEFHFNAPGAAGFLDDCIRFDHNQRRLRELASANRLTIEYLEQLRRTNQELCDTALRIGDAAGTYEREFSAVEQLANAASTLLDKFEVLTGLTEGFTLFGTRDHVHDSHFSRGNLYAVSATALEALQVNINNLLRVGSLTSSKPAASSAIDPANDGCPKMLPAIQAILVGYGLGVQRTPIEALYARAPALWRDLQDVARSIKKNCESVTILRRNPQVAEQLCGAQPELIALIEQTQQNARSEVNMEGLFGAKKGVRELRTALTHWE